MLFYVLNELKYLIQVLSIIYSLKSAESGNTIWPVKARDHASSRSIIFCCSCMWWSNWQKPQKQITVWRFYKMKTWDGIYYQIQSKETEWNCKKMMDKQLELAVTRCLSLMLHLNQQVKSKILEERKGWVVTPSKPLYSYFGHTPISKYRSGSLLFWSWSLCLALRPQARKMLQFWQSQSSFSKISALQGK